MVQKVTEQKLDDIQACKGGRKWFNRHYPKGMLITKDNLKELISKLSRLRKDFPTRHGNREFFTSKVWRDYHTLTCLSFVLEAVYGAKVTQEYRAIENNDATLRTTQTDLLDWVWEDIQGIRSVL